MLPNIDHPEAFGQHPNADIASQIIETRFVLWWCFITTAYFLLFSNIFWFSVAFFGNILLSIILFPVNLIPKLDGC